LGAELGCAPGFSDGAALGCAPGACVGSAEGATVGACVGSAAGADEVSGAGAAVGAVLGSGAELAACNHVAIYPVGGWWKNNRRQDRRDLSVRYALLVSLRTQAQDVDLYTPIATQLSIPVSPVQIEI